MPEPQPPREPTRPKKRQPRKPPPSKRPKPASKAQLLMALIDLDPLAQELMIAQRIASMPGQRDGGLPVNIPRMVRGPWAHNLRQLGIFCIPELATHELVAPGEDAGMMRNHTGSQMQPITMDSLWERAKAMDPALAREVDAADTPAKRKALMNRLLEKLPLEQRVAAERLMSHQPRDFEPT